MAIAASKPRHIFLRHVAALDRILELKARHALVGRSDLDDDVGELAAAAGLLLEDLTVLNGGGDGFLVVDLRGTLVDLDAELTTETVDDDVQVELAHTADDGLAGLLVGLDGEGRVFLSQLAEGDAEFVEIALGLGLHGDTDHGIREDHGLEGNRMVLVAHGVTGAEILESDGCADVTGLHELDGVLVVGVHLVQTGDPLFLACTGVEDIRAGIYLSGISPHEREPSDKRVGRNLEDQAAERLRGIRLALQCLSRLRVGTLDGALVERRRKVTHDGIQQELHALVLERRTAACGNDLHGNGTLAEGGDDFFLGQGVRILEIFLHEGLIDLGRRFDKLVAPAGHLIGHILGDFLDFVVDKFFRGIIVDRLAGDQVYDAFELILGADRKADGNSMGTEFGVDLLDTSEEVRADAVHLVHISDLRHAVLVGLPPDGFRLGLHPADSAERRDGTVQDTEGTLYLDREVDVPGSIDKVDLIGFAVIVPECGRGGRSDGDASLLLLDHPVHGGSPFVHLTDPVRLARVEQDTFGRGGLAGIDVGHDADVAGECKISSSHS